MPCGCAITLALVLALLSATGAAAPEPAAPISVDVASQRLIDDSGREVLFRGGNAVAKAAPYLPGTREWTWWGSLVEKDFELMASLGFNAMRLGTMWAGIAPAPGVINETYIDAVLSVASTARRHGISSLLDMHQDGFGEQFCDDGAATWVSRVSGKVMQPRPFPIPVLPKPYAVNKTTGGAICGDSHVSWSDYYMADAVGAAFHALYHDVAGLRRHWAAAWRAVARKAAALGDAVLGYELLNEPWAGYTAADPFVMDPTIAARKNLAPAYEAVAAAIREVDARHAVFFEPVTWADFGSGFERVPGGPAFANRSVLSYHYYSPPDFSAESAFKTRRADMRKLRCGGFLTEFYATPQAHPAAGHRPSDVFAQADAHVQSWFLWTLKGFSPPAAARRRSAATRRRPARLSAAGLAPAVAEPLRRRIAAALAARDAGRAAAEQLTLFLPDGSVNRPLALAVARPYPQAVAGRLDTLRFDPATRGFTIAFRVNVRTAEGRPPLRSRETVVYVPTQWHYGGSATGVALDIAPPMAATLEWRGPHTVVVTHDAALPASTTITLRGSAA